MIYHKQEIIGHIYRMLLVLSEEKLNIIYDDIVKLIKQVEKE